MAIAEDTSEPARSGALTGGGPAGNERLTAATGVVLLALLAGLGITILRIGSMLGIHMFLGIALIAPVGLKLASTGYRFVRYYTSEPGYRQKGPPALPLRLMAPIVVLSTIAVFGTGVVLLLAGPGSRDPWTLIHKVSFFVWLAFMSLHVLGHLLDLPRILDTRRTILANHDPQPSGGTGRAIALASALVLGATLGVAAIADFAPWIRLTGH